MFGLLAFGFIMMIISVIFWYIELKFWLDTKPPKPVYSEWAIVRFFQVIVHILKGIKRFIINGKYFITDMIVTMAAINILGMGNAVSGGILGLAFSNVVSALIVFVLWRRKRQEQSLETVKV